MTIIDRLRKVDLKVANRVGREKIGTLRGRVFFLPHGSTEAAEEVPLYTFQDNGISAASWATGEQAIGHRFTVNVDGDWWALNGSVSGQYSVTRFDGDPVVPVEVDNEVSDDQETYTVLSLKVKNAIEINDPIPLG